MAVCRSGPLVFIPGQPLCTHDPPHAGVASQQSGALEPGQHGEAALERTESPEPALDHGCRRAGSPVDSWVAASDSGAAASGVGTPAASYPSDVPPGMVRHDHRMSSIPS